MTDKDIGIFVDENTVSPSGQLYRQYKFEGNDAHAIKQDIMAAGQDEFMAQYSIYIIRKSLETVTVYVKDDENTIAFELRYKI